ncbi:MAG: hypothetical protein Q8R82_21070 [Hyphomonadaceae bacterium]|nr:hypothetical protein [Hyphomonadaceae bacterium]
MSEHLDIMVDRISHTAQWRVTEGAITVSVQGHERSSQLGAMALKPEVVARLLAVQIIRENKLGQESISTQTRKASELRLAAKRILDSRALE